MVGNGSISMRMSHRHVRICLCAYAHACVHTSVHVFGEGYVRAAQKKSSHGWPRFSHCTAGYFLDSPRVCVQVSPGDTGVEGHTQGHFHVMYIIPEMTGASPKPHLRPMPAAEARVTR